MRYFRLVLALSTTLLISCKDEENFPQGLPIVLFWSDTDWVNDGDVDTLFIGDTLSFTFYHYGKKKPKYIEASLIRYKADSYNGDILIFESFYPQSKNGIYDVRWPIGESIAPTPEGYYDLLDLYSGNSGLTQSWNPRIVIMEKE